MTADKIVLRDAERLALRAAMNACRRCGYVRAAQALENALARDVAERGPRIASLQWRASHDC